MLVLTVIIIWKGTLEINLSILIGSFVIKTVSMEMVISPVFLFSKPGNSKFATKTAKRKPVDTFILHKETTQKTDYNMDEQDKYHSPNKFYYPEDLETSETGIRRP